MVWHYLLVFVASMAVDIFPIPLPPAFAVMMLLQVLFDLNIWIVIVIGVLGSVTGRYVLALYVPKISGRLFKPSKNEDVAYLGKKLKGNGWKSRLFVFVYALVPLPTTPFFVAVGMAKIPPMHIIPIFFVGKLIADAVAVLIAQQAVGSMEALVGGLGSWKSIAGLVVGGLLLLALLFFDWRTLLQRHRLRLKFNIWR